MSISSSCLHPKFTALFKGTLNFTDEEFELFKSHLHLKHLNKKDFYIKPGMVCDFKAYINKGCMRTYSIDPGGHERIMLLAFEDWWVSDLGSYYSGQLATTYTQAIEDCELLEISKASFQELEQAIPKLKEGFTQKLARRAAQSMKSLTETKTSLKDNYLKLLEKQPEVFQRVPLQYIASYLNVEPQSLSRLRKRLSGH